MVVEDGQQDSVGVGCTSVGVVQLTGALLVSEMGIAHIDRRRILRAGTWIRSSVAIAPEPPPKAAFSRSITSWPCVKSTI
jgi:hypothetical protein